MSPTTKQSFPRLWPTLAFLVIAIITGAIVTWTTVWFTREIAHERIRDRSGHTLNLVTENLRGALARYQYQPRLLSRNPALSRLLERPGDEALVRTANLELERINDVTGALDTYLMDWKGLTVAASNWASDRTFIGRNFAFRPYFQAAMKGSMGRYFALGTTSGERGYYFSYPVRQDTGVIGVVVVKMDLGSIEAQWRNPDHEIVVVDEDGVVFLSSNPVWHFHTLGPLSSDTRKRLADIRRYPGKALEPLTFETAEGEGLVSVAGANQLARRANRETFLMRQQSMEDAGWRVLILARTTDVRNQINVAVVVAAIVMASLLLTGYNIFLRVRRSRMRSALQEEAKRELEENVRERTQDLTAANTKLRDEIRERLNAEALLQQTQTDLVQATKLAALGQMSAGLSHELNQPLAAIRSYADNALVFLERENPETVQSNLAGISELTERMSRIIKNLKTAAHDEPFEVGPVFVAPALTETLTMLDSRLKANKITVSLDLENDDLQINGGEVRLQQIFLNLIGNAIDAMKDSGDGLLEISARQTGNQVEIIIRDNGTGVAEENVEYLFDPFYSTKEVGKGMGLGLFIVYGLVKQFGGTITAANHPDGGAVFTLHLNAVTKEG